MSSSAVFMWLTHDDLAEILGSRLASKELRQRIIDRMADTLIAPDPAPRTIMLRDENGLLTVLAAAYETDEAATAAFESSWRLLSVQYFPAAAEAISTEAISEEKIEWPT
jgi:hypothetical protein